MSTCRWADIISSDSGYSFGRIARLESGTKKKATDDSFFDPGAPEVTEIKSINGHVSRLNIKNSPIRCSFKGLLSEISQSDSYTGGTGSNVKPAELSVTPYTNLIQGEQSNHTGKKWNKKEHSLDQQSDIYYSCSNKEPLNPTKKRKETTHSHNHINNDVNGTKNVSNSTSKKWNTLEISVKHNTSNWPSLSQCNYDDNGSPECIKNNMRKLGKSKNLTKDQLAQNGDTDMNQLLALLSTGDLDKLANLPTASIERLAKSLSSEDIVRLNDVQRIQLLQKTTLMQQALMQQISQQTTQSNNGVTNDCIRAAANDAAAETNMERINARLKDIAVGKTTKEYQNYISKVPRHERTDDDPQTPDPMEKCSSAKFRSKYRIWRVALHKYDSK